MTELPLPLIVFPIAWQIIGDIEPFDSFVMKPMESWSIGVEIIDCTHVELDDHAFPVFAFPSQRGSALAAEGTFYTRRGFVDAALVPTEPDLVSHENHKGHHRRAGVPPTTKTMAVADVQRLADGLGAHHTAHPAAGR